MMLLCKLFTSYAMHGRRAWCDKQQLYNMVVRQEKAEAVLPVGIPDGSLKKHDECHKVQRMN